MVAPTVLNGHQSINVSSYVTAPPEPSNFIVDAKPQDVSNYARWDNALTIEMKDGRVFTIENFFQNGIKYNNLVFTKGAESWLVDVSQALSPFGDGVLESLIAAETITTGTSTAALLGILGAAGAGGGLAISAMGGDEEKEQSEAPDTVAPSAPVIDAVLNDLAPDSKAIGSGQATNDRLPTFTGSGGEPGATIELRDASGRVLGSAVVGADGKWSLTPDRNLPEGSNNLELVQRDGAGNTSAGTPFVAVVDTTAPAQPAPALSYKDNASPVTLPASTAPATKDTTPGINVGAGLKDTPKLYVDGVQVDAVYDPVAGTLTPVNGLEQGSHAITYTLTDAAGNESKRSNPLVITVDTTAPSQSLTIEAASDTAGTITGPLANGDPTDNTAPVLSGALSAGLAPGEYIAIMRDGTVVGTATVTGTGWSFADSGLSDGEHGYTVRVVDAAGNAGPDSAPFTIDVDTAAPAQTVANIALVDDVAPATDPLASGGATNDTSPELTGELSAPLAAGEYVEVLRDGVVIGTATVTGTGWAFQDSGLTDGDYDYAVRIVDAAGNQGASTAPFSVTVDTEAPTQLAVATGGVDNAGDLTGPLADGDVSDDTSPELAGELSAALGAGEYVEILRDGTVVGTATVTGTAWSFTDSEVADGVHEYAVRVVDAAGNPGTQSTAFALTIDTTSPTQIISNMSLVDDVAPQSGPVASGGATNDHTPVLTGELSDPLAPGDYVGVWRDGVKVGTALVTGTGWSFAETNLPDGDYSYVVRVVNQAGTWGEASDPFEVTVDSADPLQTVSGMLVFDNVSPAGGTVASGEATNDTSPVLTGQLSAGLAAGEYLQILRDGAVVGTAAVTGTGWSFADSGLADGDYTYEARVVDAAGNEGPLSSVFDLTVDTAAPTQTVSNMVLLDDTAPATDPLSSGETTNDTSPTLAGELSAAPGAGEYVAIMRDGVAIGTATVTGTGWSFADSGLADGDHEYTARVIDAAGNEGPLSATFEITVDTVDPIQTISNVVLVDNVAPQTDPLATGKSTNDTSPELRGRLSAALGAGEYVEIFRDGVSVGTASVAGTGWSFQETAVADGQYEYTMRVVDAAGNEGPLSAAFEVEIDTLDPTQTISGMVLLDNAAPLTDPLASGEVTNDATPTLAGELSAALGAGEYVRVLRDGIGVGTATVTGTGWSFQDTGLPDGDYEYTVRVVDAAGNEGALSSTFEITVDTVAPTQTVSSIVLVDDVAPQTDPLTTGKSTNDSSPEIRGELSAPLGADEHVEIFRNGVSVGTATVTGTGWSFEDSGLADGDYEYTVRVIDAAGNEGPLSAVFDVEVDTLDPTQTVSGMVLLDNTAPGTDPLASGEATNDTSPTLTGELSAVLGAGEYVRVLRDGIAVGTATVTGTGWSFQDSGLTEGDHEYTVRVVDAAGNEGALSATFDVEIDTIAPTQTLSNLVLMDDVAPLTDPLATGKSTNDSSPALTGELSAPLGTGEYVEILRNGTAIGTATVAGTSWSFADSGLADGDYAYTARVVDAADNRGPLSTPFEVEIDTVAPTQTITAMEVVDDISPQVGTVDNGKATNDSAPTLTGELSDPLGVGEFLEIRRDGVFIGKATVTGTGWHFADSGLADGDYIYTVRVVDAAGNEGAISDEFTITVDMVVPTQTILNMLLLDDAAPQTDPLTSGKSTNDTSPTLTGELSAVLGDGEYVEIMRGSSTIGTAIVTGTGWSFADSGLADATYQYRARVVDAAGNKGPQSSAFSVTVDTTHPTQTISSLALIDDVAPQAGPVATGESTNDDTPMLTGQLSAALASGERVEVLRNGSPIGTATVAGTGWSFQDTTLADGDYEYTVRVVDAAGNTGPLSSVFEFEIDTADPEQTIANMVLLDDTAPDTDPLVSGKATNDSSPTLAGELSAALADGEYVEIVRDGVAIGTAVVTGTGWSFAESGLIDGDHEYKARVVDAAGNAGAFSSVFEIEVDTADPTQTVSSIVLLDDTAPGTDPLASGKSTNDTAPELTGELSAPLGIGEYVEIFRDGVSVGTATVAGTGWSFQDGTLAEGDYAYTVRVVDAAGNEGPLSAAFEVNIDTGEPEQTVSDILLVDDVAPDTDPLESGKATNDTSPTLTGELSGPLADGEFVEVYRDNARVGTATVSGTGWSFADSGLAEGDHTYTVRVVDAAGNEGVWSSPFDVTVDTQPPTQTGAITGVLDDDGEITGPLSDGDPTDDRSPTLTGELPFALGDGEFVRVLRNGTAAGTATVSGTGWSFSDSGVPDGDHTYTVVVVDAAGNEGPASAAFTITVDNEAPEQTIAGMTLVDDVAPDTEPLESGKATNDASPELAGELSAPLLNGETVGVWRNGVKVGNAVVDGTGWSFQDGPLADDDYEYVVRVISQVGTWGEASDTFAVTVDTDDPAQTVSSILLEDDVAPGTDPLATGKATNDTSPLLTGELSGVLADGEFVAIYRDSALVGTAAVSGTGWSFQDSGLIDGDHTYEVRVVDAAGNEGPAATFAVEVDTLDPEQTLSSMQLVDDVEPQSDPLASGGSTNDNSPLLTGELSAPLGDGEFVEIYRNGVLIGTATAGDASWSFQESGLADGDYEYTVRVVDAAGNEGPLSAPFAVNIDTELPEQTISGILLVDDVAPLTDPLATGKVTNDASPLLTGELSGRQHLHADGQGDRQGGQCLHSLGWLHLRG